MKSGGYELHIFYERQRGFNVRASAIIRLNAAHAAFRKKRIFIPGVHPALYSMHAETNAVAAVRMALPTDV